MELQLPDLRLGELVLSELFGDHIVIGLVNGW